ncbi:MAG: BamA/TamA family outer membrane protein [Ginsengibacter sp.]
MKHKLILLTSFFLLLYGISYGQSGMEKSGVNKDSSLSSPSEKRDSILQKNLTVRDSIYKKTPITVPQKDIRDVFKSVFHLKPLPAADGEKKDLKKHFSIIPAGGYTLQTGFAAIASANMAYNVDTLPDAKLSSISTSFTYTQYNQTIIPLQASIWSKGNRYNLISDFRYVSYPSAIYGLGGRIDPNIGYTINFNGLKLHQTIMKAVSDNLYLGLGLYYDNFQNITAIEKVSDTVSRRIIKELGSHETAIGLALRFTYDSRLNQINPKQGLYYNITYRANTKVFGSDSTWNSLQIDSRAYVPFPKGSDNVLAFWLFDWLTASGTPPYLLLPSTAGDDNYNTGRGYIQGRFRGRDMLYFESEYRYGITRNGILGGVLFVNVQNFSSDLSKQYSSLFPGYGLGLRVKFNKYSNANLCVDYGFGVKGSQGFFVNIGEVF